MTIYYVFKKNSEGELSLQDEFIVVKKPGKKVGQKCLLKLMKKSKLRI